MIHLDLSSNGLSNMDISYLIASGQAVTHALRMVLLRRPIHTAQMQKWRKRHGGGGRGILMGIQRSACVTKGHILANPSSFLNYSL